MKECNCSEKFRTAEDYRDHLPCEPRGDKLEKMFLKQREFVDMLVEHDRMPEYPVDMTTKPGQRLIRECAFNCLAELMEATVTLKNKMHRLTDDRELDVEHYKEELGDALAFFIEICLLSGFSADDIYEEFSRKNMVVKQRLKDGY